MSVTNAASVTQTCAQTGWCNMDYRFGCSYSRHRTRAGVSAAWMTLPKAPLSVFMQVGNEMRGLFSGAKMWEIESQTSRT